VKKHREITAGESEKQLSLMEKLPTCNPSAPSNSLVLNDYLQISRPIN
jgi:hypothetical protein